MIEMMMLTNEDDGNNNNNDHDYKKKSILMMSINDNLNMSCESHISVSQGITHSTSLN